MFNSTALSVDHRHVDGTSLTIEWDIADIDPWHIRIDNGSTEAIRGPARSPDVTLRCTWEDWTRVPAGHTDPRRLILTRRIRPRGKVRVLMRLGKLFGR